LLATLGLPSDQQRLSIIEAVHDATTSWAIASPLSNMLVRCTRGIEPLSCEKATLSELTSISALGSTVELAAMDDLSSLWVLGTSPTGEGIFLIGDNGALTPSCSPSDVSCDLGGYLGVARLSDSSLVAIGRAPALLRLVPGETWSRFAFPTLPPVSTSEALTPAPSTEASVKVQSYLVDGGQVYLFSVQRICSDSSCADGSLRLLMTRYQAGSGFSNTAIELTKSICTAPSTRCRCTSPESCAALEGRMFVAGAVIVDERVVIAGTLPESDSETTTAFTIAIPRAPQP
ncbi:MAG: hypothetical protein KC609_08130, partial [Myxococcales bacterium]|nr:hypothetical protein [Myxococcales bacterium]